MGNVTMEMQEERGQFRLAFTGYSPEAWDAHSDEDEKAYFQADISWIRLGAGDVPQAAALTAMITGDVQGLRKRPGLEESRSSGSGRLPLSLGTYELAAHKNAVAIGN